MAILALETDPARAATIQQIASRLLKTDLTLVRSKKDFKQALSAEIPDVVLLPALLSPADEAELMTCVTERGQAGHLEMLITPFAFAPESAPAKEPPSGWRGWLEQDQERPANTFCTPRAFAEQLVWSLTRARTLRLEQAEELEWKREIEEANQIALAPVATDAAVPDEDLDDEVQLTEISGWTPPPAPMDPFDIDVQAIVDRVMAISLASSTKERVAVAEPASPRLVDEPIARLATVPVSSDDRRRHVRVAGRYDGRRGGHISTAIVIHSLSEVGCFVEAFHEEVKGRKLTLDVHLPSDGWITVNAEIVRTEPEFGFGVRFIDVPEDARTRLAREVAARTANVR